MSTLDDLNAGPGGMAGFVSALTRRMRPVSRRDVLVGATVAATALATKPKEYALTPVAAYATICGPGNTASSGWTVFCSTVNKGVNTCPPGSFAAGWWKAADSSWCGGGYRYIVDCNASCSKCTTGCSDGMCDSRCWSCSCGTGSSATCDQRRVCCNAFRYGQCNTHVKCSGGVHCRVVSCVPPYKFANCTTASLSDNRTSEHSAPSLPRWEAITQKYHAMGEQASYLKASKGPVSYVGDGIGRYVLFQGGVIYYTSKYGAVAVTEFIRKIYSTHGGPRGARLGYATADIAYTADKGWLQTFERGAITDSASTTTQVVWGTRWTIWKANGREGGILGYPTTAPTVGAQDGTLQLFQKGAIVDSPSTTTQVVAGSSYWKWSLLSRDRGPLGYPTGPQQTLPDGWIQLFQNGAICGGPVTTEAVPAPMYAPWVDAGRESGVLGYPTGPSHTEPRGLAQFFQRGELWALGAGSPPRRVHGAVLTEWKSQGGATGSYGYPVTDTTQAGGGRLTCTFEGGTITA
ncbi:LGFP repeat-containing protein [Phycicoccus sp. Soil802]|uniref:LGFP repeat-containing protein n=1 Tax=Phycicoccus sp. Soil802 TaxID=1736414 RepID=UPI00070382AE|nr:hypothetical protein [Phycicoccus sp. Soil802]KRF28810.1 hypothetical protein ASG91_03940 [Phycicoccus sp. Soil802]